MLELANIDTNVSVLNEHFCRCGHQCFMSDPTYSKCVLFLRGDMGYLSGTEGTVEYNEGEETSHQGREC